MSKTATVLREIGELFPVELMKCSILSITPHPTLLLLPWLHSITQALPGTAAFLAVVSFHELSESSAAGALCHELPRRKLI